MIKIGSVMFIGKNGNATVSVGDSLGWVKVKVIDCHHDVVHFDNHNITSRKDANKLARDIYAMLSVVSKAEALNIMNATYVDEWMAIADAIDTIRLGGVRF